MFMMNTTISTTTTTTTKTTIKKIHVQHAVDPVLSAAAAVAKRYYASSGSTGHPLLLPPTGLPLSFQV